MDIRNNVTSTAHFSPYGLSPYSGAEGGSPYSKPVSPLVGDSMVALSSHHLASEPSSRAFNIKKRLKLWKVCRATSLVIIGLSSLTFGLLILQPILVVLFTFGSCVSGGCHEWLEFSVEVLLISLIPAVIAMIFGMLFFIAQIAILRLTRQSRYDSTITRFPQP